MRMSVRQGIALCIVCALLSVGAAWAEVNLPNVFGDHMVLQQAQAIPVWGTADPGEKVTVRLGKRRAKTTADADGRWMVKLRKLKAGKTRTLTVSGENNKVKFDDVLLGEVWVCSGQSNMQWPVRATNNADAEIAAADYPKIRLFSVPRRTAAEPQDDCQGKWVLCSPETIPEFSAVGYYFGRSLHQKLDVPVGLINTSWGGTPAESWTSRPTLAADPELNVIIERWEKIIAEYPEAKKAYDAKMVEWKVKAAQAKAAGKKAPRQPRAPFGPDHPWRASSLYNGMIAPLVPYGIQGAIWYQGESNADRAFQYRKLFRSMIVDWRQSWDEGDFPFLFVQLANFTKVLPDPEPSTWAELREAQTMTLSLPNTGMAVIIDIGEADNIHPRNKQDVGKRLALNALANTYGKKVAYSGPMYKSMKVEDGAIRVEFDHTVGGLTAKGGEALRGFAIAGADRKFVWADAAIDGDTIVVSSDSVADPVAVRYAWAHNPVCNLYNGVGLPASPFRTDDWPGVTVNNK
ncbi:MAG: sialate O-acetylesterase [Nitrospiraceae bacterium]|nr:sialate O-acetylesterase [Nitrospiraceae bacterium]